MFVPTFVETQRFRTDSRGTLDYILTNCDLWETGTSEMHAFLKKYSGALDPDEVRILKIAF
jgi:hypothetical protein